MLAAATAGNAAVSINFNSATGNIGNSHTYTSGGLSVTATGYASTGTQTPLYGKNAGGDENGLGLNGYTDSEINVGTDFIQLDVQALFGLVSGGTFFMGSSTNGEMWAVYGSNTAGTVGSLLTSGSNEASHGLPAFGTYKYYDFVATNGNVLLGGLSLTRAVPEPATWALMLLGFGGIGFAMRRRTRPALRQVA